MNIFRKIWNVIRSLFIKRTPTEKEIIADARKVLEHAIEPEALIVQIHESEKHEEREELVNKLVDQMVAKEIIKYAAMETENSDIKKNGRKKLYEIHELKAEFQRLEKQIALLILAESGIKQVNYPDVSSFDTGIEQLFSLLSQTKVKDKVELSDFTVSAYSKDIKELERLLSQNSALKRHKNREQEKRKQKEIYEKNIKKELNNLESLIGQNKLEDSKLLVDRLSKSIKPDYKKGIERLSKAVAKLKKKELEIFEKRHLELLRDQQEKAEKIRIEHERVLELKRIVREQAATEKSIREEKKQEKAKKLEALLTKKSNWRDFQKVLQENGITAFYHFTDYHNLKSIKENKGLYSWHYADTNGITINFPGGDSLSRDLDKHHGLQDYVRVSFCTDHPMQHRLQQQGRNLALLEVDIEVAYYENTIFCNINATDSGHKKGKELKDLERIRFSATKRRFVSREDSDFKHHQAEVLVKTWIPLEHITNINKFA